MTPVDQTKSFIAAKAIMDRMDRINDIWAQLAFFEKNKKLPEDDSNAIKRRIEEMNMAELISFCFTIYPNITRLKNRVKTCTDELKKAHWQKELDMRELELAELIKIREGGEYNG